MLYQVLDQYYTRITHDTIPVVVDSILVLLVERVYSVVDTTSVVTL
jgi:hypothetical protein